MAIKVIAQRREVKIGKNPGKRCVPTSTRPSKIPAELMGLAGFFISIKGCSYKNLVKWSGF